jgi:Mce-associated membrane protein
MTTADTTDTTQDCADENGASSGQLPNCVEDRAVAHGVKGVKPAIVGALVAALALSAVAGWLEYRVHQSDQANQQRAVLLETARQAAVNLTTISYTEVDNDVKRIVDSATGSFRDDFQKRSPAFIDLVKQAHSKSVGTVTAAGLQSVSGNQAQALVAVSVKTSDAAAPEQEPRAWRMQISVTRDGDGAKVSDVQFVP